MEARFYVPGEPVGKGRPRVTRNYKTGRSVTYTPEKTVIYENLVRLSYQDQCRGIRFDGPVSASICAYFSIPKSASKKRRQEMIDGSIRPTKKPDCDNIVKSILDSLNGIAFQDDAQVIYISIMKRYSDEPRVAVSLWEE